MVVWFFEIIIPWRKNQKMIRKDFWLDAFYMFFNFFLFSLIVYNALSDVFVELTNDLMNQMGIENLVALEIGSWPVWTQLIAMFILRDFIQYNIHRMLHRIPLLWRFHKVHHSVQEMGFAAHLRFHWMETIIYKSLEYIPLAMIGFGIDDFILVHLTALTIGHINHSNLNIPLGPLKYVINNPQMHIWHHAHTKLWPAELRYGINYGLSLSIWDYLFKTAHIPHDGKNIELGFDEIDEYAQGFVGQMLTPLKPTRRK